MARRFGVVLVVAAIAAIAACLGDAPAVANHEAGENEPPNDGGPDATAADSASDGPDANAAACEAGARECTSPFASRACVGGAWVDRGCFVVLGGGADAGPGACRFPTGECYDPQWAKWPMPTPKDAGLPHPQSFTVVGGTVHDDVTGLVWQRAFDATSHTYAEALAHCASLVVDGIAGWRVPSRIEMLSIVDYTTVAPAINASAFPGVPDDLNGFWTTSLVPGAGVDGGTDAWLLMHHDGSVRYHVALDAKEYVRCVR